MAQSDIMREMVSKRIYSDGWMTIKDIEKVLKDIHPNNIRRQVNRLVAYNFVESSRKDDKTTKYRIKKRYMCS